MVGPDGCPFFLREAASEVLSHAGLQPFHVLDDHRSEVLKEGPVELAQSHCCCGRREGGKKRDMLANTVEPPDKGHYGTDDFVERLSLSRRSNQSRQGGRERERTRADEGGGEGERKLTLGAEVLVDGVKKSEFLQNVVFSLHSLPQVHKEQHPEGINVLREHSRHLGEILDRGRREGERGWGAREGKKGESREREKRQRAFRKVF